jgi:hypothetical protein
VENVTDRTRLLTDIVSQMDSFKILEAESNTNSMKSIPKVTKKVEDTVKAAKELRNAAAETLKNKCELQYL